MVGIYLCESYPFILLFWMIVRAFAENTADFIRRQDIFVNHGFRNVTTASDIQCCIGCMHDDICKSVSYSDANKICQMNDKDPDKDETATTTSIVGWTSFNDNPQCRTGWYFYTGSCYLVVTTGRNMTDSESHCQSFGGHLADLQNAEEDRFVQDLARNTSVSGYYWIGLNDRDEEGTWVWTSSAQTQYQLPLDRNGSEDDCVEYFYVEDKWEVHKCTYLDSSICKAGKFS